MKDYIQIGIDKGLISQNEDSSRIMYIHKTVPNLSKFCTFGSISFVAQKNVRIFDAIKMNGL